MAEYSPTTWVEDSAPGISATQLNRMEAGIAAALEFTEKWQELTIPAAGSWQEIDLTSYGVGDANLVWLFLVNEASGMRYMGAREVGSALARVRDCFPYHGTMVLPVKASGANGTIEVWVQSTTDCQVFLMGYMGL